MKLHLPLSLLALTCAMMSLPTQAGEETPACNITFVGDSITQGGTWAGAGGQASYRWQFFKILVDQGVEYNPMGTCTYSSQAAKPLVNAHNTWSYRGTVFDNTHEAAASARTYTFSGADKGLNLPNIQPGSRLDANKGTVWNFLGLDNPHVNAEDVPENASTQDLSKLYWINNSLKEYKGSTYAELYGDAKPDTLCIMIGINDLYSNRPNAETIAYTHEIVQAYQQYNPDISITVMGCLPTAPNNNTYGEAEPYNAELQQAVATWSTDTSSVSYANVSAGISITNHYDSAGAHPNNQGELIVAGNLANALGYGQRTLGLTGLACADFSHSGVQAGVTSESALFSATGSSTVAQMGDAAIITSGLNSGAVLSVGDDDGWDVSADAGYTLTASIQLGALVGNTLSLQFGDGSVGDGLLTLTNGAVYWGENATVLYEGSQLQMADYRVVYMAEGNASGVDAGYYVWRNNQLIGEALSGGTSFTDGFSLSSADNRMTHAAIADISWENTGTYCSAVTDTIASSYATLEMGDFVPADGKAYLSGKNSDLSDAEAWSGGSVPSSAETICLAGNGSFTITSAIEAKGIEVLEGVAVSISSNADNQGIAVGADGISVAEGGSLALRSVTVTESQEWKVAEGGCLSISNGSAIGGNVIGEAGKTVTVTGAGQVILASVTASAQSQHDWVVTGGGTLRAIGSSAGTQYPGPLGAGSITLDNGTLGINYAAAGALASNQGNWNWGNDIRVANGGGTFNLWAPINNQAANRYILYSGNLSLAEGASADKAVLRLTNAAGIGSTSKGFIFAGDNSGYTGKLVVGENVFLRVGASSATNTGTGTNGTLTSGSIENNGTISLTRTDEWEVAAAISGTGALNVGLTNAQTPGQVVTMAGTNTYTGKTTINSGTMVVTGSIGSTTSSNEYEIASNASLKLRGNGSIANRAVSLTARTVATPKLRTTATGILTNVLITEDGISAVDSTTEASVTGSSVNINTDYFKLENVTLTACDITGTQGGTELQVAGAIKLNDVTLTACSLTGTAENAATVSISNVTFVLDSSTTGAAGDALTYNLPGTVYVYDLSSLMTNATFSGDVTLDTSALSGNSAITGYDYVVFTFGDNANYEEISSIFLKGITTSQQLTAGGKGLYVDAKSIPEPATTTLSLLALAGLAARRRRK